jgi:hypothetical protein
MLDSSFDLQPTIDSSGHSDIYAIQKARPRPADVDPA